MDIIPRKRCTKCGETKPLSEFPPSTHCKYGVDSRCRVCRRAYQRAWEQNNKERKAQQVKRWHERYKTDPAFRERQKQRVKERYRNDPDYRAGMIALQHERYVVPEIRDRILKRHSELNAAGRYRDRDRERNKSPHRRLQHAIHTQKRRAQKQASNGAYTAEEWKALCERYNHCCLACGKRRKLTADHIVPLAKGGSNTIDNIQPLCTQCNSKKHVKTIDYRVPKQSKIEWDDD